MTGDEKRGDAVADRWRDTIERTRRDTDLALTRLDVRADMKSMGEDEISEVIDQRTLEQQQKKDSEPPGKVGPLVIMLKVVNKMPWPALAILLAAALGAYVFLKLRGAL